MISPNAGGAERSFIGEKTNCKAIQHQDVVLRHAIGPWGLEDVIELGIVLSHTRLRHYGSVLLRLSLGSVKRYW